MTGWSILQQDKTLVNIRAVLKTTRALDDEGRIIKSRIILPRNVALLDIILHFARCARQNADDGSHDGHLQALKKWPRVEWYELPRC